MITIRKSRRADIPVIVEFQVKLAIETENVTLDREIATAGLNAMFDDHSKGIYFVAEYEGKIVGCHSVTYEWSDWRNGVVWWLQSVYVIESHRKYGVFRAMFENVMKMISASDGIRGLRLYVDKTNVRAQKVYQAMGMNGDHYSVFESMKS